MDAEFSKNVNEIVKTIPIGKVDEFTDYDCFIFHLIKLNCKARAAFLYHVEKIIITRPVTVLWQKGPQKVLNDY